MSCPYSQPQCPEPSALHGVASCAECLSLLKGCAACGATSRAFANFCRSCGTRLSATAGDWTGYKGSAQRLGLASAGPRQATTLTIRERELTFQLGDCCRSLLGYDRHLIAVSQAGMIEIRDPAVPTSSFSLRADGLISCEPCIDEGVLYVGSPQRLTAYSLGGLTLANPRLTPLWRMALSGTPIQALTAIDRRLYVTILREGTRELQVIENLERNPPAAGRVLHAGSRLSWTAADPARGQLVFLAAEGDDMQLHTVSTTRVELGNRPLARVPRPFAEHVPIAFVGGALFGIFGEDERLCRVDARSGELEDVLGTNTKWFSLSRSGDLEWDGDGVRVDTEGAVFLGSGHRDSFPPLERVVKGPVIVYGRAALLGMRDGRLRIYDLNRLPWHDVRRLTGDDEPITALISFHRYIAVGNVKGVVKVLEMSGGEAG